MSLQCDNLSGELQDQWSSSYKNVIDFYVQICYWHGTLKFGSLHDAKFMVGRVGSGILPTAFRMI